MVIFTRLVRVASNWYTESSRQAKIRKLQFTFTVDQEILWLQVAMEHAMCMTKGDATEKLV